MAVGVIIGAAIGAVVVYGGLSSLMATLDLSFLICGAILIATGGKSIAVVSLKDTAVYQVLSSTVAGFPVQMVWAVLFVLASVFLYIRHKFGTCVHCVCDNPASAAQMGIDTKRIQICPFVFMGLGAGHPSIYSPMINFT